MRLLVFDEGTCGRRRLVPGVLRLRKPLTKPIATSIQAPQSGWYDACSFVSITFDSAGIGSLKLLLVGLAIFGSWLIGE